MLSTVRTYAIDGMTARAVRVEAEVHRGIPSFTMVGLPDAAVRESRERVRAALINSGFEFPLQRIVVNLAPASLRKAGSGMDLAIAAAILAASGQLDWQELPNLALVGELALDGSIRPVNGVLPIAEAAHDDEVQAILVPDSNGPEAALASGVDIVPIDSLSRLRLLATGEWEPRRPIALQLQCDPAPAGPDLADIRGQAHLRHALEVAAAGGHGLLMIGPPGSGKALAASRLPSILPPPRTPEALEISRIASICGRLDPRRAGGRPFRAPHHAISASGLVGRARPPRPGEATLAHRGVLFLDELSEFRRDALEALRPSPAKGEVMVSGAAGTNTMPARFMLVAAAKPCPCGRGAANAECACGPLVVKRYRTVLGAALDGLDIVVDLSPPTVAELGGPSGEPSADVRARVIAARERQERRLGLGRCNAEMTPAEAAACPISGGAARLLAECSAPSRKSLLKVAQTVADLDGSEKIGRSQMARALRTGGAS